MARVLLLQDSGINESLALAECAGELARHGHHVHLLLGDEERDLDAQIRAYDPDMVVLPCSVAGEAWPMAAAARARRVAPRSLVAMGGTHVTFSPEVALDPSVDAAIVGEAEGALVDLANAVSAGRDWRGTANVAYADGDRLVKNPLRPLIADLDSLPMPDRDLYFRYPFMGRFPWKKFASGRGCMHACSFCWNNSVKQMYGAGGDFVRRKSPERVIAEIEVVRRKYPLRHIHFSDDLFTVYPSWIEKFAPLYRAKVGLPFTCSSTVELLSERTVNALREANCYGIAMGLETGNEDLREKILKKRVTNDDVRAAASRVKAAGIKLTTFNMIASPGETLEDALQTMRLNREIGADAVRLQIAVPIPHTEFADQAQAAGLLEGGSKVRDLSRPDVSFKTAQARELRNLYYLFRIGVHVPGSEALVRALVKLPFALDPLRLWVPFEEKRIYNLRWRDGIPFFWHIGDPHRRTTNYVTLV